jgi:hypothetical protein
MRAAALHPRAPSGAASTQTASEWAILLETWYIGCALNSAVCRAVALMKYLV